MNEHEVDQILTRLGQEEFVPSPDLVERTRDRLHRNALLPILVAVSLGLQLVAFGAFQVYLFTVQTSAPVRILAQVGLVGISVFLIGAILIAHKQVRATIERFEIAVGCH